AVLPVLSGGDPDRRDRENADRLASRAPPRGGGSRDAPAGAVGVRLVADPLHAARLVRSGDGPARRDDEVRTAAAARGLRQLVLSEEPLRRAARERRGHRPGPAEHGLSRVGRGGPRTGSPGMRSSGSRAAEAASRGRGGSAARGLPARVSELDSRDPWRAFRREASWVDWV